MSTASELRERVTIEQPVLTDDGYGGKTQSWATLTTVFAHVTPLLLTAREREIGVQTNASAGYRVEIRARTDVRASMRMVWKTHVLMIHSLHEAGEVLSILAYEENL